MNKVTLRSGTSYNEPKSKDSLGESSKTREKKDRLPKESSQDGVEPIITPLVRETPKGGSKKVTEEPDMRKSGERPFLNHFVKRMKRGNTVDYMSIFGKLEVTMLFLEVVKIPLFVKFLKDYIAGRARKDGEIAMEENASMAINKRLPLKRADPKYL